MNYRGKIVQDISGLLNLFAPRCEDRATLDELIQFVSNHKSWVNAHALFNRIRQKTLSAERKKDKRLLAQYYFEEICAKTLYNLSHSEAPFDPDSPYWIVPNALDLAKAIQILDSDVLKIITKLNE